MKRQLQIGDMVTPLVPGPGYCLGDHCREMGVYYMIDRIHHSQNHVLLEGPYAGWLKAEDVALESKIPKKKENYNYLIPILKKHKIK
jgi:hypothetical protein